MRSKIIGVYKITSPTGRIYIGSSIDVHRRFAEYKRLDCKKQLKLFRSLNKHGGESHYFEIIEECSIETVRQREFFYGLKFNVLDKSNLNNSLPKFGEGIISRSEESRAKTAAVWKGRKHSDESKKKMQAYRLGKKHSPETLIKLRRIADTRRKPPQEKVFKPRKKWFHTEETKKKLRSVLKNVNVGRKHTDEHKEKCRLKRLGTKRDHVTKKKMSESALGGKNHKAIILLNINTGIFYECFQDAAFSIGMNYNTFRSRLYHNRLMPFIQ